MHDGQCEQALALLRKSARNRHDCQHDSFNAAISAYEKDGTWAQAAVLLPNLAISTCEKGEQWGHALTLLQDMRETGENANVISCTAAISNCENEGQWEQALALLRKVRETSMITNVISFSAAYTSKERFCCCNEGYGPARAALYGPVSGLTAAFQG